MENVAIQKKSIGRRIADFWARFFRRQAKNWETADSYSRFRHYLYELDPESPEYGAASTVVDICDEAYAVTEKRIVMIDRLKRVNDELAQMKGYHELSQKDIAKIKDLIARFASLSRDRHNLLGQLDSFERSLGFMKELEKEAPEAIRAIHEAEEHQRLYKQDLTYLEGERSELTYERERLQTGLSFIQKFAVGMCIAFGLSTMLLVLMYAVNGVNIFYPMVVMVFLVVAISALMYAFRRRILYELELNVKKQARAVELINKKTVLYAHYTNFLQYEYKKFKVRNAEMLKDNLNDYSLYKYVTDRLDSIRSIMYQTEQEIDGFLRQKNLYHASLTMDKLAYTLDLDHKKNHYQKLMAEREAIESKLALLDARHTKLWDALSDLAERDPAEDFLIKHLINRYVDEASTLIERNTVAAVMSAGMEVGPEPVAAT